MSERVPGMAPGIDVVDIGHMYSADEVHQLVSSFSESGSDDEDDAPTEFFEDKTKFKSASLLPSAKTLNLSVSLTNRSRTVGTSDKKERKKSSTCTGVVVSHKCRAFLIHRTNTNPEVNVFVHAQSRTAPLTNTYLGAYHTQKAQVSASMMSPQDNCTAQTAVFMGSKPSKRFKVSVLVGAR